MTDITTAEDLRKELEQLKKSHKWTIVSCVIIFLLVILVVILMINHQPVSNLSQTEALQDSIAVHDKRNLKEIEDIRYSRTVDSMREYTHHQDLLNVQSTVDNIKHKYDKERTAITAMSDDESDQYFSEWISQTDSL